MPGCAASAVSASSPVRPISTTVLRRPRSLPQRQWDRRRRQARARRTGRLRSGPRDPPGSRPRCRSSHRSRCRSARGSPPDRLCGQGARIEFVVIGAGADNDLGKVQRRIVRKRGVLEYLHARRLRYIADVEGRRRRRIKLDHRPRLCAGTRNAEQEQQRAERSPEHRRKCPVSGGLRSRLSPGPHCRSTAEHRSSDETTPGRHPPPLPRVRTPASI